MKIRIDFSKEEKEMLVEATDTKVTIDKEENVKGKFGTFVYDPESHLELDLNTEVIKDLSDIIASGIMMVKALMMSVSTLIDRWFKSEDEE